MLISKLYPYAEGPSRALKDCRQSVEILEGIRVTSAFEDPTVDLMAACDRQQD